MKHTMKVLLPVVLFSMCVGFIVYRTPNNAEGEPGVAEELSMATGSQYGVSSGDQLGAAGAESGVPADIFFTRSVASVIFSHQTHAIDMGIKCDTCHSKTFQMKAGTAETKSDFNMQGLAEGKYCGSCHSSKGDYAFASDTQCARCHRGVKGVEGEQEGS